MTDFSDHALIEQHEKQAAEKAAWAKKLTPRPAMSFNDDDLYIYNNRTLEIVEHIGSKSMYRRELVNGPQQMGAAGLGWTRGLTAKRLGLWSKA